MGKVTFMNIKIDNVTMGEALQEIDKLVLERKKAYVVTPNVDHLVQLQKDDIFKEIYDKADLVLADGKPLIWISRLYKTPLKEKVSGSDLFPKLCSLASRKGYKMYFLGAAEGVAAKAAKILQEKYTDLDVVGTYSPPMGFENDKKEINKIIKNINESKPDILIVGLGTPKQEKFIYKYKEELNVPVSLGLGASFDFIAGNIKRAPKWMCEFGLEWLFRITQDPKRLFKRYFIDALKIIPLVWKYRK